MLSAVTNAFLMKGSSSISVSEYGVRSHGVQLAWMDTGTIYLTPYHDRTYMKHKNSFLN